MSSRDTVARTVIGEVRNGRLPLDAALDLVRRGHLDPADPAAELVAMVLSRLARLDPRPYIKQYADGEQYRTYRIDTVDPERPFRLHYVPRLPRQIPAEEYP